MLFLLDGRGSVLCFMVVRISNSYEDHGVPFFLCLFVNGNVFCFPTAVKGREKNPRLGLSGVGWYFFTGSLVFKMLNSPSYSEWRRFLHIRIPCSEANWWWAEARRNRPYPEGCLCTHVGMESLVVWITQYVVKHAKASLKCNVTFSSYVNLELPPGHAKRKNIR